MAQLGKMLIITGALIFILGVIMLFFDRLPFLGKLPGDISFKSGSMKIYIPLATSIIISIILTILLNLFGRGR
ncbi:MAG: DUF2905 domain-containing protein [candidate division Zixibacteria bacterium]|nr:DUF2905 domain-containing protein [candidate division Zixibacteria bacterium]MDD5425110.1 DUF2905 domain-containing protein [candidate division Zixibacteria bacterium]